MLTLVLMKRTIECQLQDSSISSQSWSVGRQGARRRILVVLWATLIGIYSGSHCSWTVSVMPTVEGDKESIGTSGTAGTGLITSWGPISLHTAIEGTKSASPPRRKQHPADRFYRAASSF